MVYLKKASQPAQKKQPKKINDKRRSIGLNMENYKKKPDEIEFMAKYSQAKSTEEKTRLKEEYEKELDAYFDLNDTNKQKNAVK